MPWADVGLFPGAPETRRIAACVYGDGSLPFTLNNGKKIAASELGQRTG